MILDVLTEVKKINWKSVFEQLDSPNAIFSSKKAFQNFFELVQKLKETFN